MGVSKIVDGSQFEVRVVNLAGDAYPEVEGPECSLVVAVPSESFEVRCRSLACSSAYYIAKLEVDGKDLGYDIKGEPSSWRTFKGFLVGRGNTSIYRRFEFAPPQKVVRDSNQQQPGEYDATAKLGKLSVHFYRADRIECRGRGCKVCKSRGHHRSSIIDNAEGPGPGVLVQTEEDDKKFYTAPSLSVKAGEELIFRSGEKKRAYHLRRVSSTAILALNLRCETAETLMLRKVLDPGNPDHVRLLPKRTQAGNKRSNVLSPLTNRTASSPRGLTDRRGINPGQRGLTELENACGILNGHGAVLMAVKADTDFGLVQLFDSHGVACRGDESCRETDIVDTDAERHGTRDQAMFVQPRTLQRNHGRDDEVALVLLLESEQKRPKREGFNGARRASPAFLDLTKEPDNKVAVKGDKVDVKDDGECEIISVRNRGKRCYDDKGWKYVSGQKKDCS
ncbi:hypothetical protein CBR_g41401 [Chara braunii]|uniref:Uncharacterized protein n=1 Tax=Chara braunii TaxID=69332 RepID=A0A388LVX0_CHABU|nr:hypothetical protein CBR_g41401 [Chara braunii]|eukprot:GBG86405.1 hypothetical protein CBR_g41401 [Chara braunii]